MMPLVNWTSYHGSDDKSLGRYIVIPNHNVLMSIYIVSVSLNLPDPHDALG